MDSSGCADAIGPVIGERLAPITIEGVACGARLRFPCRLMRQVGEPEAIEAQVQ